MIFQRALLREFGNLALAVFATLFAVTLTTQLIRLLGQAASGQVLSEGVLALLGFSALNYLPVLLSLTLFVTVLMAISRSYRDSEMVIWFSAGQSLIAWVRPVLTFALPLVGVIAVLSLFLSPWAWTRATNSGAAWKAATNFRAWPRACFARRAMPTGYFSSRRSPATRTRCRTCSFRKCSRDGWG